MVRFSWVIFSLVMNFTSVRGEVTPNPSPAPNSPYLGHLDAPGNIRPYNIWEDNCHTAANSGLAICSVSPDVEHVGIIVCGGEPEKSPAHHTANYIVLKTGQTCLANWGKRCCWKGDQVPPNLDSISASLCAKWACGKQFGENTRVMEPGKRVETPGPAACAQETSKKFGFRSKGYEPCLDCCDGRSDMWETETENGGAKAKVDFLRRCKQSCSSFFTNSRKKPANLGDSAGVRRGRVCADSASNWSVGSFFEQCRSCCLDARRAGDFPHQQFSSCMAVCNSEFN